MSEKPDAETANNDETQRLPPLDPEAGGDGDELAKVTAERDEFKKAYLRALADFDNYQKRSRREMERFREDATRDLLKDLVLVLDNLEMTVAAAKPQDGKGPSVDAVTKGVELVRDQLLRLTGQRGLTPLGTKPGDVFDPEKHEAVMAVPTPGLAKDEVGLVAREGYKLGSSVLRPASVQVKKAAPA